MCVCTRRLDNLTPSQDQGGGEGGERRGVLNGSKEEERGRTECLVRARDRRLVRILKRGFHFFPSEPSPPALHTPKKKRGKKGKKKKHVEKHITVDNEDEDDEVQQATPTSVEETPPPHAPSTHRPLTLKIKLGSNEVLTTTDDRLSVGTGASISNFGDEWAGGN